MRYSPAAPQKFHREVIRIMRKKHGIEVSLVANNKKHPKWMIDGRILSAAGSPRDKDSFVQLSVRNLEKMMSLR